MKPTTDQLKVLRRLHGEGQIDDDEFDRLIRGYEDSPESTADDTSAALEPLHDPAMAPEGANPGHNDPIQGPKVRTDLATNYLAALGLIALVLIVAGALGFLSWLATAGVILVLLTTLFEGWAKVTLIGAGLMAVVILAGALLPSGESPPVAEAVTATIPPPDPEPPATGSLGIQMDQIADLWNTVDNEPRITRGLTRHSEIGDYDTFIYRFGEWGRLAGAFDPDDDAVHALLVTGQLSAEATDQLYLRLCFLVAQYSQDCLDSYHELGLDGATLEDFADTTHEAEWTLDENTWRLQIEGNVLTIRVFGPDAARYAPPTT